MNNLYKGPSIHATYQVSIHLAKRFQRRRFLEINQSETRIACGRRVCQRIRTTLTLFIEDLQRMLPTKFRFIWPSGVRGEYFFRNQPIRYKNCLWRPCLLTDRDEMSNLYREPAIDASYQLSIHLAKRCKRKRFVQKSTNQIQELPVAAIFVNGSGQNEQSLQRTCHRCFLPSFGSFGQAVSEEKIKM